MAKEINIKLKNNILQNVTFKTKLYKTKTNKKCKTFNTRIIFPYEVFKAMYDTEFVKGLKIYMYKKDDNIFLTTEEVKNSYSFALIRQAGGRYPTININANMEFLEPNYKNKIYTTFICDSEGVKMFFS